jgi:hypothetical protein
MLLLQPLILLMHEMVAVFSAATTLICTKHAFAALTVDGF